MEQIEDGDREEDVLELDGRPALGLPSAPAERDGGGAERPAVYPGPQVQGAGAETEIEEEDAEKGPPPAGIGTQKDRSQEGLAAAQADWRRLVGEAARTGPRQTRRRDAAADGGLDRDAGGAGNAVRRGNRAARDLVLWPEDVEPVFRWDAADQSWSEAQAGQPDGGLSGGLAGSMAESLAESLAGKLSEGVDRLTRRGAGGLSWGAVVPGPAPGSVEEPEAEDWAGPEGVAWAGEMGRDLAGLEALYQRTAQAVRPEAPGLDDGGAGIAVRAEEPVPAAALTVEELDRAVRRDSRRYDGQMELF